MKVIKVLVFLMVLSASGCGIFRKGCNCPKVASAAYAIRK